MTRFLLPLAIFLAIVVALGAGLRHDPRELPSALVGKPAPAFALPVLDTAGGTQTLRTADLRGKVWILNVWASWCTACRTEHPVLVDFAGKSPVPVYGLNYKDAVPAAQAWLQQMGDPYVKSGVDADGRVGIDFGVYGVPETYVIDAQGVVRYRQVGPVTPDVLERQIKPLLRQLQQGGPRASPA
ncbi:Cytochrome c-type biogenesis protein CcmG/DsbE, thiol:disulfide oxidoreductase [Cupriavidus sp. U2]|uniref:DsbE family thiol:disulfide interchange protein n=1 Tax=Burkholderiaceae TaxID=119060 RepID=UPI00040F9E37|nr:MULTISPECIES: DsbE family thiol:disulfide interchange protein [Burkholderiaceae]KAI3591293.1 Cytochrome c-type biogenesis protein CcmG/DsbE, thiol:disulfide oxidoreductase [Cupriavidus sp. U2]SDP82388.1 cytochrome c biogenesis protein CcmG, thiol:disulfide interchange protein DsbE [Ralstonia sp. 25mfcol4.1]